MSDYAPTCYSCGAIEPSDASGWMEAPSGNVYCAGCFELLFRRGLMPLVVAGDGEDPS